jgi:hypothetical protein
MLFRFILLLAIAAGLAIFTWSNLQPIALVFLGIQMPALPLSWWILGGIGAGVATTLVISVLFSLSNYAKGREVRSRFSKTTQGTGIGGFQRSSTSTQTARTNQVSDSDATWSDWSGYEGKGDYPKEGKASQRPSTSQTSTRTQTVQDDWDSEFSDDWDETTPSRPSTPPSGNSAPDAPPRPRTDYETKQEPVSGNRSGSAYSYSYREPGSSGAGRKENVVDAEFRVIVPPYRPLDNEPVSAPTPPPAEENADDWFEDNERK